MVIRESYSVSEISFRTHKKHVAALMFTTFNSQKPVSTPPYEIFLGLGPENVSDHQMRRMVLAQKIQKCAIAND